MRRGPHWLPRVALAWAVLIGATATASGPAEAATHRSVTHIHLGVGAASVHVGSIFAVSGSVKPVSLKQIRLERWVAHHWSVIGRVNPTAAGTFTISVRAPKLPATWLVRAVRAKSAVAQEGISGTLHVRIVAKEFLVTERFAVVVKRPAPTVVTGSVSPRTAGVAWLLAYNGHAWHRVVSARLAHDGGYRLSVGEGVGRHRLRVERPATATTAEGFGKAFTVVVSP